VNEAGEADGSPAVARCEAAEVLEAAEASLDPAHPSSRRALFCGNPVCLKS